MTDNLQPSVKLPGGTSKRIGYIDALKGFAIICVVVGHIALGYAGVAYCPGSWDFWYATENIIYSFHMPLFFAISGFVYYKAYFTSDGEPKRRKLYIQTLNLIAIYVIFAIGFTLLKMPFNAFTNEKASFDDIIWMWMRPVGVYWYLYVLVEMYLVFSIPRLAKSNPVITLAACLGLTVISYYISIPFHIPDLCYFLIFFAAGIVYARGVKLFSFLPAAVIGLILSTVLSAVFWNSEIRLNNTQFVNVIIAFGFILAIWYVFEHIEPLGNSKILQFFGSRSLEIYVTHSIVVTAARTILNKMSVDNQYICLIVNTVLGIGLPLIFSLVVRKLKLFDILFRPATVISKKLSSEK